MVVKENNNYYYKDLWKVGELFFTFRWKAEKLAEKLGMEVEHLTMVKIDDIKLAPMN